MKTNTLNAIYRLWFTAVLCLLAIMLPSVAHAQFATGGSGIYQDNIIWVNWGALGPIPQSGTTVTNSTLVAGQFLRTTCTISNIASAGSDPDLTVFIPNGSGGGTLSLLYNSGGIYGANTMTIGVANSNDATNGTEPAVNFTLACSATLGPTNTAADPPYALNGLVMADAEGSTDGEYIQATISNTATWRIIERYEDPLCLQSHLATRTVAGANQTLRLAGFGPRGNPNGCPSPVTPNGLHESVIAFMEGATTANFQIKGDGRTAIAMGVLAFVSEQGDAPASYGDAHHLPQFSWSGGTVPTGPASAVNNPTFTLATLNPAPTIRLGASTDTENTSQYSATAIGDDADGLDDEDGAIPPVSIILPSSGAFTQTATCGGNGAAVRGFIDWNRDGDFDDPSEASLPAVCAGGSVDVTWTAPQVTLQGLSYMRLRIAANAIEVASPTGVAVSGEVEDYAVTLIPSRITLVKQLDGRATAADQFTVSIQTPTPVSVTTTGSGVNGTTTVSTAITLVDSGTTLVLRDALTAGTGAFGTYTKSIACVANAGSTGAVPVLTVPVVAGANADWTITPNLGNDLTCTITNAASDPTFAIAKQLTGESGTQAGVAEPGEQLTYTITATNTSGVDAVGAVIADALPANTTFVSASNGGTVVGSEVQWTQDIAANSAITLTVVFQVVDPIPAGVSEIANSATVDDPGDPNPPVTCTTVPCVTTPVADPIITVAKSSNPGTGTEVAFGQTITYTVAVTVANSATLSELVLVDTPDPGLTIGTLPSGCAMSGLTIRCSLPAGSPPGVYTFTYPATINDQASDTVSNVVTATGGSPSSPPTCISCATQHQIPLPEIRLTKSASVREVRIGDRVRYTLTVENVGATNLINGSLVDTPAAGFSYVEGSLQVVDGDNAASVEGQHPLRFNGVEVAAGETATLTYLMRVGAGVRPGTHQNQAQALAPNGTPISNVATAEVELVADPLLDDSLLFGTVFDDRDGDGWQDSAAVSGVQVQGGFAPGAYLANSTTVDRGAGPQPEPDASAPLLHGLALGAISARQSEADPVDAHQVIIRQRLSTPTFTDDFVLTSAQGVTVRMDAAGATTVEKHGEAGKGLNAAAPTVERRVAQGEGGYVVDYVIGNAGVDERGIPGVRIASVEGLLIETDRYGRYHLAGIPGGPQARGRHFILKVDPSTLPTGAEFSTDNPLLRRITPGLPVRFDWGVKLPVQLIEGGTEQVEMKLGEVFFAPGSAEVQSQYVPVIEKIAAKVRQYHGGEVVIDANGDTEGLAFDRATAVKAALAGMLDAESLQGLVISARGHADDPEALVVGVDAGGVLLGTVLFDTNQSAIRPEFEPLLDKIAAALERSGGGAMAIVGHTDVRASYAYNVALGMRRAKAVYEALAKRLSPEVRAKVRVEVNDDPTAPVGTTR